MKKNRIVVIALAVLMAFAFVSCKEPEPTPEPHVHDMGRWTATETEGELSRGCSSCGFVEKKTGVIVENEKALNDATTEALEIVLGADLKLKERLVLEKGEVCKIDLNGYSIGLDSELAKESEDKKSRGLVCVYGNGTDLTIDDSSAGKTGSIDVVTGNDFEYPFIGFVFVVWPDDNKPGSLTVNGGSYKALEAAISGNGTFVNPGCITITINGGKFEAENPVYNPQNGWLVITGGEFVGSKSAVEIRAGKLNITGGTFKSTAEEFKCESNPSGATTDGAAIAIAQHTTKLPIDVQILGGEFFGKKAVSNENPEVNGEADFAKVKVSVTGGKYSTDPRAFVPETHKASEVSGVWTVSAK